MLSPDRIAEFEVVIGGYAMEHYGDGYRVVNIHRPNHISIYNRDVELIETTMGEIENVIAKEKLLGGIPFMEDDDLRKDSHPHL